MAALPYIQLYVNDYLIDTAHLTAAQHGAYLLLIFNYWQRGEPLNNLNDRLANVARMSNDEWEKNKPVLAEFFEIDGDNWIHHRIERDLEAVFAKIEQASNAGKASAKQRMGKRSTTDQQPLNDRSTDVEPIQITDIKPSTSQSACARDPVTVPVTENPPESKPPASQPDKFAMFVGWKPSDHVPDQARQANVSVDAATVVEFTAHWLTKPDDRRTQLEWDKALLKAATHNKLKNAGKPSEIRSGGDGKIPVTGKFDRNSRIENYNREAAEARAKYEHEQGINTSSERDITGECHIIT